jgi:hypothetical protein
MMQANLETLSISIDFAQQIEEIVKTKKISYLDAVELWCDDNGKDISVGAELVKKSLVIKEKIRVEAEDLNLLPRTARLPI